MTQKASQLTGAAVSQEVLDSSKHVLATGQHGGIKGLQQFFTPEPAAQLAAYVTAHNGRYPGTVSVPVFDPTAGDGSLLKHVPAPFSFGVEIDPDQIEHAEGSYQAIQGDIQKAFPMIYRAAPEFPAVWANPPFGLDDWHDETVDDDKPLGSTVLTFIYATRILAADGQMVFICGKDRFHNKVAKRPEAKGIYYVVECDDLYKNDGAQIPCVIAFGVHPSLRTENIDRPTEGFEAKNVPLEYLEMVGQKVVEAREAAIGNYNSVAFHAYGGGFRHKEAWEAIQTEYRRRKKKAEGFKYAREYDVELVGGKILNIQPQPMAALALNKQNLLTRLKALHGKPLTWFATYEKDWMVVEEALSQQLLSVDPRVIEQVEELIAETRRTITPLYPIKETQRLGYLFDLEMIRCKKTDHERGFVQGESYPIDVSSETMKRDFEQPETITRGKNAGEVKVQEYQEFRKVLHITITAGGKFQHFYDSREHQADIEYLIEHFHVPDPGDVGTRYPEETERMRAVVREVEAEVREHSIAAKKPIEKFRDFQREDLARLLVKESGLLAWEQGLGKTLGGIGWALSNVKLGRTRDQLLIICPQDLIPQWQREVKRFTGRDLIWIRDEKIGSKKVEVAKGLKKDRTESRPKKREAQVMARQVSKRLRDGKPGWYITHYEALSISGTSRSEMLPEIVVEEKTEYLKVPGTGKYGPAKLAVKSEADEWVGVKMTSGDPIPYSGYLTGAARTFEDADGNVITRPKWVPNKFDVRGPHETCGSAYIEEVWEDKVRNITSKHVCPQCRSDRKSGWNGSYCRGENEHGDVCGYSHFLHRVKPMAAHLSTAFRQGAIILDEGTMIQGDYSKRSIAIRGLQARTKLLMTGTPIKNYISQAFWPLWWCLGNKSKRFPYGYKDKYDFEDNHAVIRYPIVGGKKGTRQVLPEVTNLSQLWRLFSSSIIRRRKEECFRDDGSKEPIVRRTLRPVTVPLGQAQAEQIQKWIKDFHKWDEEMHPERDYVKAGMAELMAPLVGLGMKLDYACTVPEGDPDHEWTGVEVSNYTPANLRTLLVTMALVKQGRKVIVGSQWLEEAEWLTGQLKEKGVDAVNFIANGQTVAAPKRAKEVAQFQDGDAQVLVASIQSIRFGHNIDAASAVVVNGLPWSFDDWDQFIARAHRFTSPRPVDYYVILPGKKPETTEETPTITRRKWDQLRQKGDAAALALDGRLIEENIEEISESEVTKELVEKGVTLTGDEVPEDDIADIWKKTPRIEDFEPDEALLQTDAGEEVEFVQGDPDEETAEPEVEPRKVTFDPVIPFPLAEPEDEEEAEPEAVEPDDFDPEAEPEGWTTNFAGIEAVYEPRADVPLPGPGAEEPENSDRFYVAPGEDDEGQSLDYHVVVDREKDEPVFSCRSQERAEDKAAELNNDTEEPESEASDFANQLEFFLERTAA